MRMYCRCSIPVAIVEEHSMQFPHSFLLLFFPPSLPSLLLGFFFFSLSLFSFPHPLSFLHLLALLLTSFPPPPPQRPPTSQDQMTDTSHALNLFSLLACGRTKLCTTPPQESRPRQCEDQGGKEKKERRQGKRERERERERERKRERVEGSVRDQRNVEIAPANWISSYRLLILHLILVLFPLNPLEADCLCHFVYSSISLSLLSFFSLNLSMYTTNTDFLFFNSKYLVLLLLLLLPLHLLTLKPISTQRLLQKITRTSLPPLFHPHTIPNSPVFLPLLLPLHFYS